MYFVVVILLTVLLPAGSVLFAHNVQHSTATWMMLAGAWMAFWAVGVRLLIAGLRQAFQPRFTSEQIFGIKSDDALPIVQELGFANIAMSIPALLSLADKPMLLPAAITGGLYYGIAGAKHVVNSEERNLRRTTAMITDLLVFAVLAAFLAATFFPAVAR
jgi:hypothetical protein